MQIINLRTPSPRRTSVAGTCIYRISFKGCYSAHTRITQNNSSRDELFRILQPTHPIFGVYSYIPTDKSSSYKAHGANASHPPHIWNIIQNASSGSISLTILLSCEQGFERRKRQCKNIGRFVGVFVLCVFVSWTSNEECVLLGNIMRRCKPKLNMGFIREANNNKEKWKVAFEGTDEGSGWLVGGLKPLQDTLYVRL